MQQGIHVNGWRLNVKEKTFQVIVSVLIIVLSIYIASKCINTIVKDKAKEILMRLPCRQPIFLWEKLLKIQAY